MTTQTATANTGSESHQDELLNPSGAIYWPARAYTHYQTWAEYNPAEIDRDFSYAADLNLNALRIIVGWEFWRDNPDKFQRAFDHLLKTAHHYDIQLLPVLFESIGETPTQENFLDNNVVTSFAVKSPSLNVIKNRSLWDGPRQFVDWFTTRYGQHDALLAEEIMNEPGDWDPRVDFCQEMLRTAGTADPDVPLTMGSKDFAYNQQYSDPELDIYQFHYNLPETTADMQRKLREAEQFAEETGKPIWLTEWQRTRRPQPPHKMLPDYSSLASTIFESDIDGNFFWQLMLKPANIDKPRKMGRLNGLVHEDGAVYSKNDAWVISGEPGQWTERREWPAWAEPAESQWAPCSQPSTPNTCSQGSTTPP
jgi:hypothetical protein